jgi:hypothetical protein
VRRGTVVPHLERGARSALRGATQARDKARVAVWTDVVAAIEACHGARVGGDAFGVLRCAAAAAAGDGKGGAGDGGVVSDGYQRAAMQHALPGPKRGGGGGASNAAA